MSEEPTINLPISTLQELHCFICKGYLSCSPVRLLLSGGNYICGRCSPSDADASIQRILPLEAVLRKVSFPCVYNKHGCMEMLLFGQTADHESKCVYRSFPCPVEACPWKGVSSQLFDHFHEEHSNVLKGNGEFKLDLDQDGQGIFMAVEDSLAFIVKYFYNAAEKMLKYDIRFCTFKKGFDVFSKIQLVNGLDAECSINLKMNKCLPFDESFYEMQNANVLNFSKFLENLGDPDCVVVRKKLKTVESDNSGLTTSGGCDVGLRVNFDYIESLKCNKCHNYLVPPLFKLDGQIVCCSCAEGNSSCTLLHDTTLLKHVSEAIYPCRWRDCSYVGESYRLRDHVTRCQFCLYRCVYYCCTAVFKLTEAANHLQSHVDSLLFDNITYKTSFVRCYTKNLVGIVNNTIVLIKHCTKEVNCSLVHTIKISESRDSCAKIIGVVHFEHKHCRLRSKKFVVNSGHPLTVSRKELPACFASADELWVTVKLDV